LKKENEEERIRETKVHKKESRERRSKKELN
jgi:hypothetical protein